MARSNSRRLRRTWYQLVTRRRLRYPSSCIQSAVSRALPKVLSAAWPSTMQQAAFSGSGPWARSSSSRSTRSLTPEMNSFFALPAANSSSPTSSLSRPPVTTTIASVVIDGSARVKRLLRTNQARPATHSRNIAAANWASRIPRRRSRRMPRSRHTGEPAQYHDARGGPRDQRGSERDADRHGPDPPVDELRQPAIADPNHGHGAGNGGTGGAE